MNFDNLWDEYAYYYNKFTPNFQKELLEYTNKNMFGNVLDAGTGVGKLIPYLENNKNVKSITGIDYNKHMLKYANQNKSKSKSKIIKHNLDDLLNLNYTFDSISSLNVIYSINNPIQFLQDSYKLLNPHGKLIISSQNRVINPEKLISDCSFEFKEDKNYLRYLEINEILTSKKSKIMNYDLYEFESISKLIGFKILDKSSNFYHENNFTFILGKK